MRETYLELIEQNWTEEEKKKIRDFLRKERGKEELTIEEIPFCFGFYSKVISDCRSCLLNRLCELSLVRITIPLALSCLEKLDIEKQRRFINALREFVGRFDEEVSNLARKGGSGSDEEDKGEGVLQKDRVLPESHVYSSRGKGKDAFGFRIGTKQSEGLKIIFECGGDVKKAAEIFAEKFNCPVKQAFRYFESSIAYSLRKRGYKVVIENGIFKIQNK